MELIDSYPNIYVEDLVVSYENTQESDSFGSDGEDSWTIKIQAVVYYKMLIVTSPVLKPFYLFMISSFCHRTERLEMLLLCPDWDPIHDSFLAPCFNEFILTGVLTAAALFFWNMQRMELNGSSDGWSREGLGAKKKSTQVSLPNTSTWIDFLFQRDTPQSGLAALLHNFSAMIIVLGSIIRVIVAGVEYKHVGGYYVFASDFLVIVLIAFYLKMIKTTTDLREPQGRAPRTIIFIQFVSATLRVAQIIHDFELHGHLVITLVIYPSYILLAFFALFPPKIDQGYESLATFDLGMNEDGKKPADVEEEMPHPMVLLMPYLWPKGHVGTKIRVSIAFSLLIIGKLVNTMVPLFLSNAVNQLGKDESDDNDDIPWPWKAIVLYTTFRLLSSSSDNMRNAVFARVTEDGMRRACVEVFEHLFGLSLRFHVTRQTGSVLRAVDRGSRAISSLLQYGIFNIVPTFFEVSLVIGVLWYKYNPWYGIMTFMSLLFYVFFTFSMTEYRKKLRREANKKENEANNQAVDGLLNFETVKYFNNESHEVTRYDKSLEVYVDSSVRSQVSLSMLNIGQQTFITLGLASVLLLAGKEVRDGRLNVGDFVLLNSYMIQIFIPLNFLGSSYSILKQSQVDLENMFSLLRVNKEVEDKPDAVLFHPGGGEIVFDNVHFSYNKETPILKGVSFRIPPGKSLAIVGPTGSGKTTISRLLYRFYDVTDGAILVDGQDIRSITQSSYRRSIGIVPQDTVLFNDTIAYNISYGAIGCAQSDVENAARRAEIHDFISKMPEGYQTKVGERGLRLSGGEKQRVSIARLLLKNPLIMIFDEATSALDSKTEANIQKSLSEMSSGRTTIAIAHRLSTVVNSDEIIVLKFGVIAERGTHQQLLQMKGEYYQMWTRQVEEALTQSNAEQSGSSGKKDSSK